MRLFKKNKKQDEAAVQAAGGRWNSLVGMGMSTNQSLERRLYRELRERIPVIDAAVSKLIRLIGGFRIKCGSKENEADINAFLADIRVDGCGRGINSFISVQLGELLTYGTAVGEIVLDGSGKNIAGLYNASLDDVEFVMEGNPFDVKILASDGFTKKPVKYPALIMCSTILNEPGKIYGCSVLRGLPFVGDILGKIFNAVGTNWDRVGNVRFAVSYKPGENDRSLSKERAKQIASEWSKAMKSSEPTDFISVGDVDIKVIGADNQIPDSSVPARLMLEQIVAKLSIPPFLLGLNWSSTERMSAQQADILTSELEYYRRSLEGSIRKICTLYFALRGIKEDFSIEWDNINLQDEVELAKARLYNAQAMRLQAGA